MLTDNLFLVHYCHPNCKPFQNIMRLSKENAFLLAEKLAKENPDTTAFYRFADFANYYYLDNQRKRWLYHSLRLKTEKFLYDNFFRLGGKARQKHPYKFWVNM